MDDNDNNGQGPHPYDETYHYYNGPTDRYTASTKTFCELLGLSRCRLVWVRSAPRANSAYCVDPSGGKGYRNCIIDKVQGHNIMNARGPSGAERVPMVYASVKCIASNSPALVYRRKYVQKPTYFDLRFCNIEVLEGAKGLVRITSLSEPVKYGERRNYIFDLVLSQRNMMDLLVWGLTNKG